MDGHRARSDSINMSTQFPASTSGGHDVSPPLRVAASDLTQSSVADASDSNSPPSTSSSLQFGTDPGASSSTNSQVDQPRSLSQLQATSFSRPLERVDSGHDTISSTPFYSPPSSRGVVQLTPGQKRTASGSMKCSVSPDRPFSALTTPGARYHSRSASTDSHSSRIAEVRISFSFIFLASHFNHLDVEVNAMVHRYRLNSAQNYPGQQQKWKRIGNPTQTASSSACLARHIRLEESMRPYDPMVIHRQVNLQGSAVLLESAILQLKC